MCPGEKVLMELQLSNREEEKEKGGVLECYAIAACLYGEEQVIAVDGSKRRSRNHVFDTDHIVIRHPESMERLSLELILPLDAPYTIRTDLVEITVSCRVDVTVKLPNKKGMNGGTQEDQYKTLTVDFPVRVVSSMPVEERGEDVLSHDLEKNIMNVVEAGEEARGCGSTFREVITPDVLNDLNMLSINALSKCKA